MRKYLILLLASLLVGCLTPPEDTSISSETYDVTEADVYDLFDKNLITSKQVTVQGVGLGDNLLEVFRAFGRDSSFEEFPEDNIINVRYANDQNVTTVIFHLVNNSVERIAIKDGLRDELIGRTAERRQLQNITLSFGKPDKSEDVFNFRIYTYSDKGLEIYHRRKRMFGFGLIPPS